MKSKLLSGFKSKKRTKEEIDKDYAQHAGNFAYKTMMLDLTIQRMQTEIDFHMAEMNKARKEAANLPLPPVEQKEPA